MVRKTPQTMLTYVIYEWFITHKTYLIVKGAEVKEIGGKCNVIYGLPLRKIGPIMHHSVSSTEDKGIFSFYNADISCDISPRRSLK